MSESATATTNTTTGQTTATMGDAAASSAVNSTASASVQSMPAAQAPANNDFKTQLGEYATDPAFKDFKDASNLAKSYKEARAPISQKIGIPDDKSTPEA